MKARQQSTGSERGDLNLVKRIAYSVLKWPKLWTASTTLLTLVAGASALVSADFGAPFWMFVPLLLWLTTVGLPTTLAVLLVATAWGRIPGGSGLLPFILCATAVAFLFQAVALRFFASKLRGPVR
jgi:hypothetical protein